MPRRLDLEGLAKHLRSALVSDALDALGLRCQCLAGIAPLDASLVLVGCAFPVETVPVDQPPDVPYTGLLRALDSIGHGDVFVASSGPVDKAALWGELLTTSCLAAGVAGAVCDGPVRDSAKIRALNFPCFSRGTIPYDISGRLEVERSGVPVTVSGVRVEPGDLLVGDADGVVCVPRELQDEVVAAALAKASGEDDFRRAVAAGMKPSQAFARFRVL